MTLAPLEATLLIAGASWRLWRLLARDDITEWARDHVHGWPALLLDCPWCLGSWLTFAVTTVAAFTIGVASPVLVALAASALVGLFQEMSDALRSE